MNVGILHPGAMGVSLAATARNSGHSVYWASVGRSAQTRDRAVKAGLIDAGTLDQLCGHSEVIVSVCPPHAAEKVAGRVGALGFTGLYLDANAISPALAHRVAERVGEGGAIFIDGGIIGGPAWEPGRTWLYLSGPEAGRAAACFAAGPLETQVIGEEIGKASALKMCFAANSKGTTALICATLAAAERLGVRAELEQVWSYGGSAFARQAQDRVVRVTAKAWRFAGEMEEIAGTFEGAGLPGQFHLAAAELYRRIAHWKDSPQAPGLESVLAALAKPGEG